MAERRARACYHEAGHAVARWWMGFHTDLAAVLTKDEVKAESPILDRRGNEVYGVEGLVSSYAISVPFARKIFSSMNQADRRIYGRFYKTRTEMAVFECYAGPFAEARFTKRSVELCFMRGGGSDADNAERIAGYWFAKGKQNRAAHLRAEKLAAAFVRSPAMRSAIEQVADALCERGLIDGDEIDTICAAAFNAPFEYDRWAGKWPPTAEQIRSGRMPILAHSAPW